MGDWKSMIAWSEPWMDPPTTFLGTNDRSHTRVRPDVLLKLQANNPMRTRILTLFTGGFLLAGTTNAQLQRIVLQGADNTTVHTDLAAALTAAQAGDKLFFSGGTFSATGPFVLDKPLHFIGAGIHPDSSSVTAATTINITSGGTGHFNIVTAASGSTFTGIIFNSTGGLVHGTSVDDDDPTGLVFQRCEFKKYVHLGFAEGAASSSTFDECVFREDLSGRASQAVFTRCIFDGAVINLFRPAGLFMRNCVVFNSRLQNSSNANVQNCVFTYNGAPLWQVSGVNISNSLITGTSMFSNSSANTETNTIYGVAPSAMFVNETSNSYEYSDDLELAPGSGGIGAGADGTDIGIHGTSSPFKYGAVPYNPHFQQADIAPATDWNGALPVTIRTAAQSH